MNCSERMNIMSLHWVFIPVWSLVLVIPDESQENHLARESSRKRLVSVMRKFG